MHYTVIFLILSSTNEDIYLQMKLLSTLYFNKFNEQIKFFFIEYKSDLSSDIIEDGNTLYVNGVESYIPGMYHKTMKSIEYINNNYSFDYIVRTNLSTFWHIPNLLNLVNNIPKEKFACGYAFQGFITGTGIIITRDVGVLLYTNQSDRGIHEDVAISMNIQSFGIHLHNITNYKWGFLIPVIDALPSNCRYLNIDDDFSDILHFRIKNEDRNLDVEYFKKLLLKLYNINVFIDEPTNIIETTEPEIISDPEITEPEIISDPEITEPEIISDPENIIIPENKPVKPPAIIKCIINNKMVVLRSRYK
jgi:hypothetical protein